ncbi:MAG: hypothetical protein HOO92_16685 [Methylococcaceae bacterium]|nr:hypothetical protein [Methylococcaceae bacterium]
MLHSNEVSIVLDVLKITRANMCRDFLEHNPVIYTPSYKYELSPKLLEIARDRYFLVWLSSHWQVFITYIEENCSIERHDKLKVEFSGTLIRLLSRWSILQENSNSQLNLGLTLIKDMENGLNAFIQTTENTDALKNKLVMALEKNRILFDRQIKKLEGEL